MFKYEVRHELRHWLSRWPIYFYATVFICFAGLIYAGTLGLFDPIPEGGSSLETWLNSPGKINEILLFYHKLMLILLPMVIGASLYKDYSHGAYEIIYSYPIKKIDYLVGRFCASIIIVIAISVLVIMSLMGVENLDGLNPRLLGPLSVNSYLQTLIWYIIPNWVIFGLLTFAVVMYSRKIISAYLVILVPILIQLISENAFAGNLYLTALFDPFAQNVAGYYQLEWDIRTINETPLPVTSLLLLNRCFWLGVGMLTFFYAYQKFEFASSLETRMRKKTNLQSTGNQPNRTKKEIAVKLDFSYHLWLQSMLATIKKSFIQIIKSWVFWIITGLGLLSVVFIMFRVTQIEDFTVVPATQLLIGSPLIIYSIIIMLMTFIYSGMLVNKESEVGMDQLVETTSVPIPVLGLGKLLGLVAVQVMSLLIFGLTGVLFQLSSGYYDFQLGLYLQALLLHALLPLLTWALVSVSVQMIVQKLYLGIFILVVGWIGIQGLASIGIDSYLLQFNSLPQLTYSEFNKFGFLEKAFYLVGCYWLSFSAILMIISLRSYRMNHDIKLKERLLGMERRKMMIFSLLPLVVMIILGSIIYGEERVQSSEDVSDFTFEEFQNEFSQYKHLTPPKIVSLKATLELYPQSGSFECIGHYLMVNQTDAAIDTLLIKKGFDEKTSLALSISNHTIIESNFMKTQLLALDKSLDPGDTMRLNFLINSVPNSLFERNSNVLNNGTFLRQDIFPRLGYAFDEQMPHPADASLDRKRHYQSWDADELIIDLTIGTEDDQIAVAPGRLLDSWKKEDRTYFRYKTTSTKFSFGITSAAYSKETKVWEGHTIESYALHQRTLPSMIDGVQVAIEFGERHFGEYPHDVIRLVEFPLTEGTFATAFNNTLMISEARFLTTALEGKTDIAFYISAHETLHHWWGNEVKPAYAKGATMLTESITEYLMLRLLQENKGVQSTQHFYEKQKSRYLNGKRRYKKEEPPLILAEANDQFITYGKGAINLYDLSDAIGEKRFNNILSEFFKTYRSSEHYPTSYDFVEYLEGYLREDEIQLIDQYLKGV